MAVNVSNVMYASPADSNSLQQVTVLSDQVSKC